ncbi:MAG: hypothetical protein ACRDQZ_09190 [Mycobacteriales bacterium]
MSKLVRSIKAIWQHGRACSVCGKSESKRVDKAPAPIKLTIMFTRTPAKWQCEFFVCMTCAKKISSRLDTVIERIEGAYGKTKR